MTSTFVCVVSVKSRNLVPVNVLKHCMRKFSVSSTSRPDDGSGREANPPAVVGGATGLTGFNRDVMAWTLSSREQRCLGSAAGEPQQDDGYAYP